MMWRKDPVSLLADGVLYLIIIALLLFVGHWVWMAVADILNTIEVM